MSSSNSLSSSSSSDLDMQSQQIQGRIPPAPTTVAPRPRPHQMNVPPMRSRQQRNSRASTGNSEVAVSDRLPQQAGANGVWIHMILDESGSMSSVADATIHNFNEYIEQQKKLGSAAASPPAAAAAAPSIGNRVSQFFGSVRARFSSFSSSSSPPSAPSPAAGDAAPVVAPAAAEDCKEQIPVEEGAAVSPAQSATGDDLSETIVSLTKFDAPNLISVYERMPISQVPPLSRETYHPNGGTNLLDAIGHVITKCDEHLSSEVDTVERPAVLIVIMTDGQENESHVYKSATIRGMIEARKEKGWTFVFLGANIDAWSTAQQYGIPQSNAFNFSVTKQERMRGALQESTARYRCNMSSKQKQVKAAPAASKQAMFDAYTSEQTNYSFFDGSDRAMEHHS